MEDFEEILQVESLYLLNELKISIENNKLLSEEEVKSMILEKINEYNDNEATINYHILTPEKDKTNKTFKMIRPARLTTNDFKTRRAINNNNEQELFTPHVVAVNKEKNITIKQNNDKILYYKKAA